jgi:PadR family transcriptional regulator PadR
MKLTHSVYTIAEQLMRRPLDERYGAEIYTGAGMNPGTCYPILSRMLKNGWVKDRWETAEQARETHKGSPPRRYYTVTSAGMIALRDLMNKWERARGSST